MKLLKTIGLVVLFISLTTNTQAQQKKSYAQKKSAAISEYVAKEMKLDKAQKAYLHEVLLNKMELTSKKLKDKNLSEEQKKAIHKESFQVMNTNLLKKFSKKETQEIYSLMKEYNASIKK